MALLRPAEPKWLFSVDVLKREDGTIDVAVSDARQSLVDASDEAGTMHAISAQLHEAANVLAERANDFKTNMIKGK